jgi:hypothetical protein
LWLDPVLLYMRVIKKAKPVENFDGGRQEKGSGSAKPSTISIDGHASCGVRAPG